MSQPDMFTTYKQLLATASMEATSEGFVRMKIDEDEYIPVTGKDGALVVLPTNERLRDKNITQQQVFHVLRESGSLDTDMLSRYRHWLISRLNIVIGGLGEQLLIMAASRDITKNLRPDQQGFLELVADTDVTTVENFNKLADMAAKANQIKQVFASIYLQPAAVMTINGEKQPFKRIARVNFPIFDELKRVIEADDVYKDAPKAKKPEKPDGRVFDAAIRVKDRPIFIGLMRYLLPELDVINRYDVGSNSTVAPGLDAMMRAFAPIAEHLNAILDLFAGVAPEFDRRFGEMRIALDWIETFHNLDALWPQIRSVPAQGTGVLNEPAPVDLREQHRNPQPAPAPQPQQTYPQVPYQTPQQPLPWQVPTPQPAYQPQYAVPAPVAQGGSSSGMSVDAMMRALGQQQQYPNQGYPQPPQYYHPQQPQQQQQMYYPAQNQGPRRY